MKLQSYPSRLTADLSQNARTMKTTIDIYVKIGVVGLNQTSHKFISSRHFIIVFVKAETYYINSLHVLSLKTDNNA